MGSKASKAPAKAAPAPAPAATSPTDASRKNKLASSSKASSSRSVGGRGGKSTASSAKHRSTNNNGEDGGSDEDEDSTRLPQRTISNASTLVVESGTSTVTAASHAASSSMGGGPPPGGGSGGITQKLSSRGSFVLSRASTNDQDSSASNAPGSPSSTPLGNIYHGVGYFELPRGGYIVRTRSAGPIQFGIPPETIKDSLTRGMSVPAHFVIYGEMFDRKAGLSKAEFEFPIYFTFFVSKSRVNIITTRELELRIRQALKETLIGPGSDCNVAEDYASTTFADALPNFQAEAESLDPSRKTLDDVVRFTLFNPDTHTAVIPGEPGSGNNDISIRVFAQEDRLKGGTKPFFEVSEGENTLARVPCAVKLRAGGKVGELLGRDHRESTRSKYNLKQMQKKQYEQEEMRHLLMSAPQVPRNSNLGKVAMKQSANRSGMLLNASNNASSTGSISAVDASLPAPPPNAISPTPFAADSPSTNTVAETPRGNMSRKILFESTSSSNITGAPPSASASSAPTSNGSSSNNNNATANNGSGPLSPANGSSSASNNMSVHGSGVLLVQGQSPEEVPKFEPFDIPVFGVTMMGASHGFDASGRTTGFVLWMNRRGLMVDPPPDSSQILEMMGVPPRAIEGVFLTHTHADHDAGTFQRILRTKQIRLYATRTIERSFITKYSAITGFDASFLRSLFEFIPVQCGENCPLRFNGGEIHFFYGLHTIPCVGFAAYFGGHSLTYSADTRYDPALVEAMFKAKLIGRQRAKQLAEFNFDHSVVLHELGVPPIHTPVENLRAAAFDEKHYRKGKPLSARLFVVHSARGVGDGFSNQLNDWDTIRIMVEQGRSKQLSEIISVLSNVDWLEPLGTEKLSKLAKLCKSHTFRANDLVAQLEAGEAPTSVWIVMSGAVDPEIDNNNNAADVDNSLVVGDTFGEAGLLLEMDMLQSDKEDESVRRGLKRIPGVPLSIEIVSASAGLISSSVKGVTSALSPSEARTGASRKQAGDASEIKKKMSGTVKLKTHNSSASTGAGAANAYEFPAQTYRAASKAYLIEVPNKAVMKIISTHKPLEQIVRERLRRFNGWPDDLRWQALQRNAQLLKLLTSQLAVRDFLANLSEDFVTYPSGHVLEDGRNNHTSQSAYFVKEGVLRVTPMQTAFSFRATTETKLPGHNESIQPFECARGSLVGDFNALIKRTGSPFRIICVEPCEIYHLELQQLNQLFVEFPGLKFQFLDRVLWGWMLHLTPDGGVHDAFGGVVVDNDKAF